MKIASVTDTHHVHVRRKMDDKYELELRVIAGLEDGVDCWSQLTNEEMPHRNEIIGEGIWQWRARVNIAAKEISIKLIAERLRNGT